MSAPNDLPVCEVCLRRPRHQTFPYGDKTYDWEGCNCDAPLRVKAIWLGSDYPPLPAKQPLVVNDKPVEGDVSFHPKVNPALSLDDQRKVMELIANATPEQVAKLKRIIKGGNNE